MMMAMPWKKFALLTFVLALVITAFEPAPAQPLKEGQQPSRPLKPALEFEESEMDFGEVEEGEKVSISYKVTNTSDRAVRLIRLHTGCGCTTGNNPDRLAPGEEGVIQAIYNTTGRRGKTRRTMTLYTNDTAQPRYELTYTGDVISPLYWERTLLDFGTVNAGEGASRTVSLFSTVDKKLNVNDVKADNLTAKLVETKPFEQGGKKGNEYVFEMTIPEDHPVQDFFTRVQLDADLGDHRVPTLSVRGSVQGDVIAKPRRVYSVLNQDQVTSTTTMLISRSETPFKVLGVEAGDSMPVKFEVQEGENPGEKILVSTMDASQTNQTRSGTVTIQIESENGKRADLELPVFMIVRRTTIRTPAP